MFIQAASASAVLLITGRLDLSYLTLNFPLTIMSSAIPQGIDFSFAHLRGLDLSRDVTGPVMGDRSTVEGDVLLTGGIMARPACFASRSTAVSIAPGDSSWGATARSQ
jgi:hypothetical protein